MTPVVVLLMIAVSATAIALYKRPLFEKKIKEFLGYIRITGVGTTVDDLDRMNIYGAKNDAGDALSLPLQSE